MPLLDHKHPVVPISLGMTSARTIAPLLIASIAGFAASSAFAQSEPADPAPGNPQQVEDARAILPRVGTNQTPVSATKPNTSDPIQPGLTQGQDWLRVLHETLETKIGASTLAEGAFVLGRLGELVKAPNGLLIFVPDPQTREQGEGAVLLMPCSTLEQLQSEWSGQQVLLSGEIFTYHNRNQLLISDYRFIREIEPEASAQSDPAAEPEPEPQSPIEADPDVRDLLEELDRTQPRSQSEQNDPLGDRVQTLPRTPVQQPAAQGAGPEEGTLLVRRPARMIRNPQGAWTLVFDNDEPDSTHAEELVVLPCRALMRMEQWAMQQGDAARFLISGRVYTYQGQSYLLPTLAQRQGPSDLNSIQ